MDKKYYWVYILYCENNSYYTGYTTDLDKRYQAHLNGKASKYTRSFKPVQIAQYWKLLCDKRTAMQIERHIKNLSRLQKEKLIASPSMLFEFFK
ncbi:MAG: GIY-YIG nuclease family protein [Gammaproteobacteria bacterium]|nr:GIY-YIG nuclease family protein [Gammaproteobacteria bacterium]